MAYLLLKARKKIYHGTAKLFKTYAKSVTDHPGVYFIIGVLIAVLAFVGIPLVKIDDSLDTVWMEQNSRFVREQNIYIENFGSLPRLGVSAFSKRDGGNVITKQGLESIAETIKHLYAFDSPKSIRMTKMIDNEMITFGPDDFCERPILPDIYKTSDPTDPLSYVRRGAYQSWGYVELSKCLNKDVPTISPLPDGWGIDKTPCMRVTVLDCFKEGNVDYPDAMKTLEKTSTNVALLFMREKASDMAKANACLDTIETQMRKDMTSLGIDDPVYKAAKERFMLGKFTWMAFVAFGYHWRPSINDFANDAELVEHVQLSLEAVNNTDYGIEKCLEKGLLGQEKPRCCMIWAGSDVGKELYLGKPILDETKPNKWVGISSVRNPVVAQPPDSPYWLAEMKERHGISDPAVLNQLILDWENNTIQYLKSLHYGSNGTGFHAGERFEGIKVDLHTDRSTGDMAVDAASPELHLLILGAALMILYSFVVMGSFSNKCINSNILTMFLGFVVSGMAVVGSTGIMGFMGFPTISLSVLVQLAGFILCLGNVYILMFTFNSRLDTDQTVETNMENIIEYAGHVTFVITATLLCGFLCGLYVPIPGFRSICIQMVAINFLSFLLLLFMFMPAMVWNCKRTQDNRMDCVPIKRQDGKPPKDTFLNQTKDLFKNYPTIKHSSTKQSLLSKFASSVYGPVILNKVVRIVIIGVFIVFFGCSAYATLELTSDGLMMSDVAKPGTYQSSFAKLNEKEYEMFSSYVVTRSRNYAKNQRRNMEIYDNLAKNDWLVKFPHPRAWDWLSDGMVTLTGYSNISQGVENAITRASFERRGASGSDAFLDDSLYRPDGMDTLQDQFLPYVLPKEPLLVSEFNDRMREWLPSMGSLSLPALSCVDPDNNIPVSCTAEGSVLVATRTAVYMKDLTTHDNILSAIASARSTVDDTSTSNFETFIYGFIFGFWGLYESLRQNFALLCGCILVGIVVPVTVLHCSLNAAFLIALCMVVGVFQVFGSFWVLGINFNGFSLVPLVLGIALVVQYSILVIHSFIGLVNDRKKRAKKTLAETFPAIFSAAFSLFLLIIPLAFTAIPFLRSYIALIFLSIAFCSVNIPLILLPCILSLMGPRNFDSGCEDGEESESDADITPAFIPPLATDDFKQGSGQYTRLTLRGDNERQYDTPAGDSLEMANRDEV